MSTDKTTFPQMTNKEMDLAIAEIHAQVKNIVRICPNASDTTVKDLVSKDLFATYKPDRYQRTKLLAEIIRVHRINTR
jgi:hypothetical protein